MTQSSTEDEVHTQFANIALTLDEAPPGQFRRGFLQLLKQALQRHYEQIE